MLKKLLLISIFCSCFLYSQNSQTAKTTLDAVSDAYGNEINSSFMYAKFSSVSKNKALANLFQVISDSKSWHANILYDVSVQEKITDTILKAKLNEPKVGTDIENLKTAISTTYYEYTKMYPDLLKIVNKDNQKEMANEINRIIKAEKSNNLLFTKAMNDLQNNEPLTDKYYLCEWCGYVEANSAPDKCPVCGQAKNTFKEYK